MDTATRRVVLGLGNTLNRDEGVGVHALAPLASRLGAQEAVELLDGGTLGLNLLPIVEECSHLLVLDAVNAGKSPGTVVELRREQIPLYSGVKLSEHQVTFQEVRTHLGVETQRQWSDLAILRTTPALLGLFSLVTLLAQRLTLDAPFPKRHTAWYHKPEPTFSDALALTRRYLLSNLQTVESRATTRLITLPSRWLHGLLDATCYST
mgnify:CR=1 FL=1